MSPRTDVIDQLSERMTRLADAFRDFSSSVPGLRVDVVGYLAGSDTHVHPVAGFEVRLQGQDGAGVSLYISASYAELTSWTARSSELQTGRADDLDLGVTGRIVMGIHVVSSDSQDASASHQHRPVGIVSLCLRFLRFINGHLQEFIHIYGFLKCDYSGFSVKYSEV